MIGKALSGASNPKDIGIERSARVICDVIETLTRTLGNEKVNVFAGIAGAGSCREALAQMIRNEIQNLNIELGTDVDNILSLCFEDRDGCAVICGTGSVAYVKRGDELHRVGGWGYMLDSGGSGYDIGRDGIEAVLRASDGRGASTLIAKYVREKLGKHPKDALDEIYSGGKSFIASFAECVFAADEEGDMVAGAVLDRNAYKIAEYVTAADGILQEPFECILAGGIVENHPDFVGRIRDFCADIDCRITVNTENAVYGALKLAKSKQI